MAAGNGVARIIRVFIPLMLVPYKPFFCFLVTFPALSLPILPRNPALSTRRWKRGLRLPPLKQKAEAFRPGSLFAF